MEGGDYRVAVDIALVHSHSMDAYLPFPSRSAPASCLFVRRASCMAAWPAGGHHRKITRSRYKRAVIDVRCKSINRALLKDVPV